MGITRPTLSRQLHFLEKNVCQGVKLIKSSYASTTLTHAGLELSYLYQPMQKISDQIQEAIARFQQPNLGLLRIAVPIEYGQNRLFPLLQQIKQQFPELKFQVFYYQEPFNPENSVMDLTIAIQENPPCLGLRCRVIDQVKMGCYATPEYLEKHSQPEHPQQLLEHRCILVDSKISNRQWQFTHSEKEPIQLCLPEQSESQNQAFQRREWIQNGHGIGCLPHYLTQNQNDLVPILTDWTLKHQASERVYLCYFRELTQTPSVRFFIDQLVTALQNSTN